MSLREEKENVLWGLIFIMNEGLSDEDKLTGEMLRELREKVDELIKNDF
jgi:hypothetical protein